MVILSKTFKQNGTNRCKTFKSLSLNTKQRVDAIHFCKITKVCDVLSVEVVLASRYVNALYKTSINPSKDGHCPKLTRVVSLSKW